MKRRILFILVIAACTSTFTSCFSKKDRAEKLIRQELSKTLYDYDSYQPIETTVSPAKRNVFNDTTCWNMGGSLAYGMKATVKCIDEMDDAKSHMAIWGPPSYYSSSYSDQQYYKYKDEYEEALLEFQTNLIICKSIASELLDSAQRLDTTQIIGWEVHHDFRCKTRGGNPEIAHYRYVISKDFKTILICEREGEDSDYIREAIESVFTDFWEED